MAIYGYLKQSTAAIIKLGPFVDDTDGKTAETALSITATDIRLAKNGGDMASVHHAQASAAIVHDEIGIYDVNLDTTDTNTLGRLTIDVHKSGALPIRQGYIIVKANWYDSMFDVENLDVNIKEISDDTGAADNAELAFDGNGYGFSACTIPTVTTLTNKSGFSLANSTISAATFANSAINASVFATGALDANAIATGAIDADAIADNAIDAGAIANNAITADKIAADAITNAKIADDAIAVENIKDGAITAAKIASDAIENVKIKDGAISAAKIANDALENAKFKDGAITAAKIASDTIEAAKIKDGAITDAKINTGAITAAKFAANAIDAAALSDDAIDAIWDEVMEGVYTARQYMRLYGSALFGRTNTNGTIFKDVPNTKTRITATVFGNNRTNMVLDGA